MQKKTYNEKLKKIKRRTETKKSNICENWHKKMLATHIYCFQCFVMHTTVMKPTRLAAKCHNTLLLTTVSCSRSGWSEGRVGGGESGFLSSCRPKKYV